MFPWVDGFHWTAVHIVFLSLFLMALLIILWTFVSAIWRTSKQFRSNHATEICWRETFAEMPEAERRCRHQLARRVAKRTCDNAFDCRSCENYSKFAGLPSKTLSQHAGVDYSNQLLYHRGHTWVRPEDDGTITIGLDEFVKHLVGMPDSVELPEPGEEIESNGIAWRMTKNDHEIRVRAPLDGTVVSTGGANDAWCLKIRPQEPVNLRHLLHGPEVAGWLSAEIDRLQVQLAAQNTSPCLADGGTLMPDLMDAEAQADWDTVLASTFLDS